MVATEYNTRMKSWWSLPSQKESDNLNDALKSGQTAEDDLVIVDEKLREQVQVVTPVEEMPVPETSEVSNEEQIDIRDARNEAPLVEYVSDRQGVRLLLITQDQTILEEGSLTYQKITDLRNSFLEIHIVVLNYTSKEGGIPMMRFFNNVWMYPTNSSSWWTLSYDAYNLIEEQLVFSGGFRADVIVAEDPCESGIVGVLIGKKYARPFQLHLCEDFFDSSVVESHAHPTLYEWIVSYVMKHAKSVRTKTEFQRQAVVHENEKLEAEVELLPSYYNLNAWKDMVPSADLHVKYPQFKFIILHITSMRPSSHSIEVLSSSAKLLNRYPTIGLVVVGNGPQRPLLERHAIALGIQRQVEFEPMRTEVISYMKSANVFVHLSEDGSEDDLILEAAVSKLPLIANLDGLAGKLFVDGESARLCLPADIECISDSINMYLNENQDRARYSLNAESIVFERIEQNYGAYLQSFTQSIERSMVSGGSI